MVNPFKDVFAGIDEYTSARVVAEKVGLTAADALHMGIRCAQLGLTEEDLQPMARVYLTLKELDVSSSALRHIFTQLSRAYNATNGSTEPTNY